MHTFWNIQRQSKGEPHDNNCQKLYKGTKGWEVVLRLSCTHFCKFPVALINKHCVTIAGDPFNTARDEPCLFSLKYPIEELSTQYSKNTRFILAHIPCFSLFAPPDPFIIPQRLWWILLHQTMVCGISFVGFSAALHIECEVGSRPRGGWIIGSVYITGNRVWQGRLLINTSRLQVDIYSAGKSVRET